MRERTVVICKYAKCDMHLEVLAAFKSLRKISQNPQLGNLGGMAVI